MKWDEVVKGINAGFDTAELQAMDTANKTGDLLKMIDAGMTAEQIRTLDTDGLFSYAGAPDPKPAADPKPAEEPKPAADPAPDIVDQINNSIKEAFDTLTKELVKMQVAGSQQPNNEQGTDDILAQIIAPTLKERGK